MRARILTLAFLLIATCVVHGATQKVLYTFTGGLDGGNPYAGVIFDKAGNIYGVTETGGAFGHGTVFQLTPSGTGWTETVLYSFSGGGDGNDPVGGLAIDDAGALWGSTISGGDRSTQCGTIFRLTPSGSTWTFSVMHTFLGGSDGCGPAATGSGSSNGSMSGTTVAGGASDQGTMFSFPCCGYRPQMRAFSRNNGYQPWGAMNAWDYVATYFGGLNGLGTISEWACCNHIRVVKNFSKTGRSGYNPIGDLLPWNPDGDPKMFGVTYSGGIGGRGAVYRLTLSLYQYDVWSIKALHGFSGPDGDGPGAGVIMDAAGNLYGTTMWGGTDPGYAGTVFKLTPGAKDKWTHTLLYSFTGAADGGVITSGVVMDSAGNLYGTASRGGAFGQGVVYEIEKP